MGAVRQAVGPALAEWDEDDPLCWTLSDTIGKGSRAEHRLATFDLRSLQQLYSQELLMALKGIWIDSRLRVRLTSVETEAFRIRAILKACQDELTKPGKHPPANAPVFERINVDLLVAVWAIKDSVPKIYLASLRRFYRRHRHNDVIFSADLHESDFPGVSNGDKDDTGSVGQLRRNVLGSALSRATLVHILNVTEAAYESGELDLSLFAFSRLLLSRAARPESFRVLRLKDLQIDESDGTTTYYLNLTIPKARTGERPVATVRLHADVGRIHAQQRMAVAERYGCLVDAKNSRLEGTGLPQYTIGDLPLFPANGKSGRLFQATKDRLALLRTSPDFHSYYMEPLRKLAQVKMNHLAIRHTMGTQLAIAGCSTSTIAAVLLHATQRAAGVYVDLVFSGAIDELSDSLESAFLEHFPVIKEFASTRDALDPAKRIVSSSSDRSRRETTGQCGRSQICQYAPITCYDCHRFKPCYDADHTINLDRVNAELVSARDGGLPREVDVKRYTHIANRIRIVIMICEAKRKTLGVAIDPISTAAA